MGEVQSTENVHMSIDTLVVVLVRKWKERLKAILRDVITSG
jgi:hypothetical protein